MDEFKDAEEELLPFEESCDTTSVPLPDPLQNTPQPPTSAFSYEKAEDTQAVDQKVPTFSGTLSQDRASVQIMSISLENSNEVTENATSLPNQIDTMSNLNVSGAISEHPTTLSSEAEITKDGPSVELNNQQVGVRMDKKETTFSGWKKQGNINRALVDTTTPFESVKEAVTRFGGIVDWKAHRALAVERRKHIQLELEKLRKEIPNYKLQSEAAEDAKSQVIVELDNTKRVMEELKLNLEKTQTEEAQAKQDSELTHFRAKELKQCVTDEASVAAKAQLEVATRRHEAAVAELTSVRKELEELQKDYDSLLDERDNVIGKSREAVLESKEIEKTVEDLTLELIVMKESLESAHTAHLEAEEHRIGAALARDQDCLNWEKELKQAEEEVEKLNEQLLSTNELKQKLDIASTLLLSLNSELASYMESKLNEESESGNQKIQDELKEVKNGVERGKVEANLLRIAESSLKSELEKERAGLANMRQREGMASIAVSSLEAEIERTKEEINLVLEKEKDAREKMVELPQLLQRAAQEAGLYKADVQSAQDELRRAKEDAEQAKAAETATETRLNAVLKEIEAAKASERLVLLIINALQESEAEDISGGVSLALDVYYNLSKRAQEAEELLNELVTAAIAQIAMAKELEMKTLEKLEGAHREMDGKKEELRIAAEKAEKAKGGKLGAEQELRKWRAEHEQRRASNAAQDGGVDSNSQARSFESKQKSTTKDSEIVYAGLNAKIYTTETIAENDASELKGRRKKKMKKRFFPRLMMFLAKKKAERL